MFGLVLFFLLELLKKLLVQTPKIFNPRLLVQLQILLYTLFAMYLFFHFSEYAKEENSIEPNEAFSFTNWVQKFLRSDEGFLLMACTLVSIGYFRELWQQKSKIQPSKLQTLVNWLQVAVYLSPIAFLIIAGIHIFYFGFGINFWFPLNLFLFIFLTLSCMLIPFLAGFVTINWRRCCCYFWGLWCFFCF